MGSSSSSPHIKRRNTSSKQIAYQSMNSKQDIVPSVIYKQDKSPIACSKQDTSPIATSKQDDSLVVTCDEHIPFNTLVPTTELPSPKQLSGVADVCGVTRWYDEEGQLHRDGDLPAVVGHWVERWYHHGRIWRDESKPQEIVRWPDGSWFEITWTDQKYTRVCHYWKYN